MQLSEELIKKIEIEFLKLLSKKLNEGSINRQIARDSASYYLSFLPFQSAEDIITKAKTIAVKFPELDSYPVYVLGEIEGLKTQQILEKMRKHMKKNEVDQAISLMQTNNGSS